MTAGSPGSRPAANGGLWIRVASAAVLAPAVLVAVWLGTPWLELLVLLGAAILAGEWIAICGGPNHSAAGFIALPFMLIPVLAAAFGAAQAGLWLTGFGALAVAATYRVARTDHPLWLVLGVPYVALPCLTLIWLRQAHEAGAALTVWLLLVVWATDSGAYFAGRAIGGPRLAPRISPNKTWAGLAGGMAAAALVGASGVLFRPDHPLLPLVLLGALLAVVAQGGDLFESHVKRCFGLKDAGRLIPGHGGLLDRVDGLMTAALALGAVLLLGGGPS